MTCIDSQALVVYAEDALDQAAAAKCPCPVYLWKDFLELGKDVDSKVRCRWVFHMPWVDVSGPR